MEIFKSIPGYKGYTASNFGNVESCKNKKPRILKNRVNKDGYLNVILSNNGRIKHFYVHRLVMLVFKGFSELEVNHKNGIKSDNNLDNLEYCTHSENTKHSSDILGNKNCFRTNNPMKGKYGKENPGSKVVYQYTKEKVFIKKWGGVNDTQRKLGINGISGCCSGRYKTAGGFIWSYDKF